MIWAILKNKFVESYDLLETCRGNYVESNCKGTS